MARLLLSIVALLGALVWTSQPVEAHADLQQAEPAVGGAVPAPPIALRLRFTEPLDRSATRVEVFDERGARVDRDEPVVGPPNDRLLTVDLADIGEGVYTVRWWSLSQVDGHRWQGTYRFGVGRTPPPVEGAQSPLPSVAELAVQWSALAAMTVVVGALAFRAWAFDPVVGGERPPVQAARRLGRTVTVGLILLAVASVGEAAAGGGWLSGTPPPETAGFAGLGKAGALALLRLFLVPMIGYLAAPGGSTGMALAFAALLVLTRGQASHAAVGGLGPVLVDSLHQLSAAIWVGGATAFAVVVPGLARERREALGPVGTRFGQLALLAAGLAGVSGVASGWLLGIDPARLLESRYGQSLAIKLVLVAGLVGVARLVWRRRAAHPQVVPRAPLATEIALGLGVVLAAGTLALLPPPGDANAPPLRLVQPTGPDGRTRAYLTLDRVRVGNIQAEVRIADDTGRTLGQTSVRLVARELAPLNASLDQAPPVVEAVATEQPDGRQVVGFEPFARAGWWRIDLTTTVHLQGTVSVPFDILVPDPNRAGVDPPASDPAAERLFQVALGRMDRLQAVRQRDILADGEGGAVLSVASYGAPDRYRLLTDADEESIAVGAVQAFRRGAEPWRTIRRTAPFRYPTYREAYAEATSYRLGHRTDLDGQSAQILTFYVPRDRAWYCWWLDEATGLPRRESMVAPSHYMTTLYDGFDQPTEIVLPE